jgi:exodeoxyribonuclease-5
MRELLGRQEILPMKDDKLVCLRNDHDEGLLNGTLWMVNSTVPESDGPDRIVLELTSESGGSSVVVEAHTHYFEGRENELSHWVVREAQCFDYGYALTVHKAQGSQWESVFVFDESRAFRESANQWLYTAITRASEKVVICRN